MSDLSRLIEGAQPPIYRHRLRYWIIALYLPLILVIPIPAVTDLTFGWAATFGLFFCAVMFIGFVGDSDVRVKELYADALRTRSADAGSLADDDQPWKDIAARNVRHHPIAIIVAVLCFAYLAVAFIYNASNDLRPLTDGWSWIVNGLIVAACIFWLIWALVAAMVVPSVANQTSVDMEVLMDGMGQNTAAFLLPHDRNDLELVGLSVQSQTLNRRVDAYTLESTLLSALAFSAFISIVFSDRGPAIGDQLTTAHERFCPNLNFTDGDFCIPYVTVSQMSESVMFYICALLLLCSISFMSVLVTRLRFSDAIHYTEETIRTAEKLNDKENDLEAGDTKTAYSAEIDRLLMRARAGFADIAPMVGFMKSFRDVGILSFIGAVGVCGFVYSVWVAIFIVGIFAMAFLYGIIDTQRRKAVLIPLLASTVLSINRRVHR